MAPQFNEKKSFSHEAHGGFLFGNKKGEKLSLSHASVLTALVTQSSLETNASSRMMTHHPA